MLNYEQENFKNKLIAGCDEVGRGCVAGPLVAACVIFPIDYKNDFINDSKKLTSKKRNELFEQIKKDALDYCIIERSVEEINNSNPKKESQIAMELCIKSLKVTPEHVLTDFEKISINIDQTNLIKGDEKSINIAAASILAKVYRDNLMIKIDKKYPLYDFKSHKGYLTKKHKEALEKYGVITGLYRIKYKPIAKMNKSK